MSLLLLCAFELRGDLLKKAKFEKRISQGLRQPGSKGSEVGRSLLGVLKNSNKIHVSDGNEEKQEMRWENWEVHSLIYPSLHSPNE